MVLRALQGISKTLPVDENPAWVQVVDDVVEPMAGVEAPLREGGVTNRSGRFTSRSGRVEHRMPLRTFDVESRWVMGPGRGDKGGFVRFVLPRRLIRGPARAVPKGTAIRTWAVLSVIEVTDRWVPEFYGSSGPPEPAFSAKIQSRSGMGRGEPDEERQRLRCVDRLDRARSVGTHLCAAVRKRASPGSR